MHAGSNLYFVTVHVFVMVELRTLLLHARNGCRVNPFSCSVSCQVSFSSSKLIGASVRLYSSETILCSQLEILSSWLFSVSQVAALVSRVGDMPCSNLDRDIYFPNRGLLLFLSIPLDTSAAG